MGIDYTKLINNLMPVSDGEHVIRMRVGVVDSVNTNHTVNVVISGIVVPNVPKLAGLSAYPGQVVQVITYQGVLLVLGATASDAHRRFVVKSSDQSNATTTLTDVTDMNFTVVPNANYWIQARISYQAPIDNTTGDIRFDWTVPSGGVMHRNILSPGTQQTGLNNNITTLNMIRRGAATAQAGGGTGSGTGQSNLFTPWWEDIWYIGSSTGGTVQLRFSQNSGTGGTPTTTVRADSMMLIERIS